MFCFFKLAALIVLSVLFNLLPAWAIDYTTLNNEELYELQGAIKNAPETEQKAYAKEWQLRVSEMDEEEAKRYTSNESDGTEDNTGDRLQAPFIQGSGYEKNAGSVIYGGGQPGKGENWKPN